jgi:hypothetical protein
MSALVAGRSDRGAACAAEATHLPVHDLRHPAGGGSTLEHVVAGVWEDLAARALAVCLVCGDEMRAPPGRGLPAVCRGCGSKLL